MRKRPTAKPPSSRRICLQDSSESDTSVVEDLSESDNSGSESGMDVSIPQPGPSCSHPRRRTSEDGVICDICQLIEPPNFQVILFLFFGWTVIFVVCGFTTTACSRRMTIQMQEMFILV